MNKEEVEEYILRHQLSEGDYTFANLSSANNHLDIGYTEVSSNLVRESIVGMSSKIILGNITDLDYLAAVPNGATKWGIDIARVLSKELKKSVNSIVTSKISKRKFVINGEYEKGKKVVVIDDATSDGGTSEALAQELEVKGFEIGLIFSIFFRGKAYANAKYERVSLIKKEIPRQLDWKYFRETGKIRQLPPR